jgi:hypothetical protein
MIQKRVGGWGGGFNGKGKERVTRNGKDPVIVETPEASSGGGIDHPELNREIFFDLSFLFFLEKEKGGERDRKNDRNNLHLSSPLLSSPPLQVENYVCTAIRLL